MNNARFDFVVTHIKEHHISRVWLDEHRNLCVGQDYPETSKDWVPVGTYSSANFRPEYLREDIRFAETNPEPALEV